MKQFSISSLLLFITVIALGVAVIASQLSNYSLQSENAELLEELDSCDFIIDRKYDTIQQYRLGASYLVKLSQSEEQWPKYAQFLSTIDRHGFAFKKFDLNRVEGYSIYCYSEAKRNPDLTERANYTPRSLCILVKDDTLEVIDSMMGRNGLYSVGFVGDEQGLTWETPDGSMVEYRIMETGFTPTSTNGESAE